MHSGVAMTPLITVLASELPNVPDNLRGIASVTVFAEPSDNWLEPDEKFVVVSSEAGSDMYRPSPPEGYRPRARRIEWQSGIDFPCSQNYCKEAGLVNPGTMFFEEWEKAARDCPNHELKIGGWPNTETVYLARRPPDYMLQVGALCPLEFVERYCDGGSLFLLRRSGGWAVEFVNQ
jgi:hypothetical protein